MTSDLRSSGLCIFRTCKRSVLTEGTCHCNASGFYSPCVSEDRVHIFTYRRDRTRTTEAPLIWADTLSNVHTPTPAGPPTLLEDGQCYRGNQFKQGLDGWEVGRLAGKDMHHLKQQDVTSDAGVKSRLIRRKRGNLRWHSACVRSHEINVRLWFIMAASLRVWTAQKPRA